MKIKVANITVLCFSILVAFIIAGCFVIISVTQPSTIQVSQQFTSTVVVSVEGISDANPHYGIVGLRIPNDFQVDSVWFTGGYTGVCAFLPSNVPDNEPGGLVDYWTDSLEGRYPSGANMKWVVYQSTTNFLTLVDTVDVSLMVKMRAGTTQGNFNIGYFVSDAALDFTDPTYYSANLNNPLSVTGIVPVELSSFTATSTSSGVQLNWETASETNNLRFEIERSTDNQNFSMAGFVKGSGTTTEKSKYSFTDKGLNAGNYYYRLKQYDYNGSSEYSKVIEVEYSALRDFSLLQNYPNPFNPGTTLSIGLPVESDITLSVYNAAGELVNTLSAGKLQAGTHRFNFDASILASGIYFYTLNAKGINGVEFNKTAKMLLLK